MKPRFIEVIRLGVLVGVIGVLLAIVLHGPADTQDVLRSMSGDGVNGWFSTGLMLMKWLFYAVILTVFACAACLFLSALGILTTILEKLVGGLAWLLGRIRGAWSPTPLPLDTVVETSKSGAPITLGQVLKANAAVLAQLKTEIKQLKELTRGLEPPPPPKSAEELLAEKDAMLERMQAELAQLRAAANRKTVIAPGPVAEPKEPKA